jgi:hypothetical protein
MVRRALGAYAGELSGVLRAAAVPYGVTLTVWGSGAAVTHFRGTPRLWEIFLFLAGGVAGYSLLLLLTSQVRRRRPPASQPGGAMATGLRLLSVGAAVGGASLAGQLHGWMAWPLASMVALVIYLALAAGEDVAFQAVTASRRE